MLVVGDREQESRRVSLRRIGRRDLGARTLDEAVAELAAEVAERRQSG